MNDIILSIVQTVVPWVLTIILGVTTYYLNNKKLPETIDEWKSIAESAEQQKGEILSFFDQTKPMSDTSLETIKEIIPASTYQMSDESQERVLSYCSSEEEKQRVLTEIYDWENPKSEGEECCDYTLITSGGVFRVQYGVPELVSGIEHHRLSQSQINEICSIFKDGQGNQTLSDFNIMWQIMKAEREDINEYTISDGTRTVSINDGEFSLSIQ